MYLILVCKSTQQHPLALLKSIFPKNEFSKTVSHRNLQKLPRY